MYIDIYAGRKIPGNPRNSPNLESPRLSQLSPSTARVQKARLRESQNSEGKREAALGTEKPENRDFLNLFREQLRGKPEALGTGKQPGHREEEGKTQEERTLGEELHDGRRNTRAQEERRRRRGRRERGKHARKQGREGEREKRAEEGSVGEEREEKKDKKERKVRGSIPASILQALPHLLSPKSPRKSPRTHENPWIPVPRPLPNHFPMDFRYGRAPVRRSPWLGVRTSV